MVTTIEGELFVNWHKVKGKWETKTEIRESVDCQVKEIIGNIVCI